MEVQEGFYVGYLSRTRGLKGELQIFFEFPDYRELELDVLFLEIDRKLVPFFVKSLNVQTNSTAYVFLEDIDHIDKAQPLLRKKIYLPHDKLPARNPDDFRWTDLEGYEVHDKDRGVLGTIHEIHEYPQQFVAAVIHQHREILFPLNEETIVSLDTESQRIHVGLPDGLIDLYLS